ncbi:hypothetical protein N1027_02810 [Herbiconiux sp. CPCC 205763]|uniref:Uncharacterized protein n=1 Tax=Herbiconiux aconitum TaxID=2970913 RepID=A0ABT2GLF4_9MICO|nr:hypothetical protein [Herbiconiux aconitum]MCS5717059.1 hypothetical protein [Herbiconiux aconitum]
MPDADRLPRASRLPEMKPGWDERMDAYTAKLNASVTYSGIQPRPIVGKREARGSNVDDGTA